MSFERPQHLNLKRREKRLGHTLCPLQVSLGLLGEALEVGCLCGQCPYLVGHISAVLRPWAFFFFFIPLWKNANMLLMTYFSQCLLPACLFVSLHWSATASLEFPVVKCLNWCNRQLVVAAWSYKLSSLRNTSSPDWKNNCRDHINPPVGSSPLAGWMVEHGDKSKIYCSGQSDPILSI